MSYEYLLLSYFLFQIGWKSFLRPSLTIVDQPFRCQQKVVPSLRKLFFIPNELKNLNTMTNLVVHSRLLYKFGYLFYFKIRLNHAGGLGE